MASVKGANGDTIKDVVIVVVGVPLMPVDIVLVLVWVFVTGSHSNESRILAM
jgi:hypothetical protein